MYVCVLIKRDQTWPLAIISCQFALSLGGTAVRQSCGRAPAIRRAAWRLYAKAASTEDRKTQNHSHQSYETVHNLINFASCKLWEKHIQYYSITILFLSKNQGRRMGLKETCKEEGRKKIGKETKNLLWIDLRGRGSPIRLTFFLASSWPFELEWFFVMVHSKSSEHIALEYSLWRLALDVDFEHTFVSTPNIPESVGTCSSGEEYQSPLHCDGNARRGRCKSTTRRSTGGVLIVACRCDPIPFWIFLVPMIWGWPNVTELRSAQHVFKCNFEAPMDRIDFWVFFWYIT